eukprot:14840296-Alexandrium_andersonii.AAC.1
MTCFRRRAARTSGAPPLSRPSTLRKHASPTQAGPCPCGPRSAPRQARRLLAGRPPCARCAPGGTSRTGSPRRGRSQNPP